MTIKFKVPAHRILVKLPDLNETFDVSDDLKKLGFKVAHESGQEMIVKTATEKGVVVDIGPMAWKHSSWGYGTPEWQPWCKVGDTILFGKYAGKIVTNPDTLEEFMLINDDDVQLVLEKE